MAAKPTLVLSLTSPYARKARMIAIEKKIDFDVRIDVPWNEDTGVVNLNPLGKVPVWITSENEVLFDSRVIVEYLDTLQGPSFIPETARERIHVKKLEALADGVMDAALVIFAERKKRPAELLHPWWVDRQFGKIHRGLKALDEELSSRNFFFQERFSLADVATACALGYVGLRFSEDFSWEKLYPNLARFYQELLKRPSVRDTVPVL